MRKLLLTTIAVLLIADESRADAIEVIEVTAARRPISVEHLSHALAMAETEAVNNSLLATDALRDIPGVQVQQTTPGQGAAIIRGQKGSAVLHLVDGMRLNNAIFRSSPTQYLALVPPVAIERMEVLRGTPASLYGSDGVGGVIQVVSHVPVFEAQRSSTRGRIDLEGNSAEKLRSMRALVDWGSNRYFVSLGGMYADLGNRRTGSGDRVPVSGYSMRSGRILVGATPQEGRRLLLDVQLLAQPATPRVDELIAGFGQVAASSSEYLFRPNRRTFVHGEYRHADGWLDLDWDADIAWQRIDDDRRTRDFQSTERIHERNRSDLLGLTVSAARHDETRSWIIGAELYHDTVRSARESEDVPSGAFTTVAARFPDHSTVEQLGLFTNLNSALAAAHWLSVGLRFSAVRTDLAATTTTAATSISNNELSADVGWTSDLGAHWQFVANAGLGFRAPNVFDVGTLGNRPGNRFNVPTGTLDSENVVHIDAGFRYRSDERVTEIMVYELHYTDRITSALTGDVTADGRDIIRSVNAAAADVRGIEFRHWQALESAWSVELMLDYARGEERLAGADDQPADRMPPLNGKLALSYAGADNWDFATWVEFADRQGRLSDRDIRDSRIDPAGTPGWVSVGVSFDWRASESVEWRFSATNLGDKRYREHGSGIDSPGRNLSARVSFRWD